MQHMFLNQFFLNVIVSWDFLSSFFSLTSSVLGPCLKGYSLFCIYCIFEFAKKFKIFYMHAVSMTLHAWCMRGHGQRIKTTFSRTTLKSENGFAIQKIKNAFGVIDTACKYSTLVSLHMWHCIHNRRTIREALAAFKGNIYQQHVYARIVLRHHYKSK
jgi:hypothetical protein